MVLGGKDQVAHSGRQGGLHPLPGIEACGIESGWAERAVAPFFAVEGVNPKVAEHAKFLFLPAELERGGFGRHIRSSCRLPEVTFVREAAAVVEKVSLSKRVVDELCPEQPAARSGHSILEIKLDSANLPG